MTRDGTHVTCLSVRHLNHYTRMSPVLLWGYNWAVFTLGWFCPIHRIQRKSVHFGKTRMRVNPHLRFLGMNIVWTNMWTIFCIVIAIVWIITDVNAPTWYTATHYYANNSRNSSRLKNRWCELTLRYNSLTTWTIKLYSDQAKVKAKMDRFRLIMRCATSQIKLLSHGKRWHVFTWSLLHSVSLGVDTVYYCLIYSFNVLL